MMDGGMETPRPYQERIAKLEIEVDELRVHRDRLLARNNITLTEKREAEAKRGELQRDFEATLLDRNELLAHYQRTTARVLALEAALAEARKDSECLDRLESLRQTINCIEGPSCFPDNLWTIWSDDEVPMGRGKTLRDAIDDATLTQGGPVMDGGMMATLRPYQERIAELEKALAEAREISRQEIDQHCEIQAMQMRAERALQERIAELEAQLAEARKDTERLDWMDRTAWQACARWLARTRVHDNIRSAIDDANTAIREGQ